MDSFHKKKQTCTKGIGADLKSFISILQGSGR